MIEIGPNLKEILRLIIEAAVILVSAYFLLIKMWR